ncbi:hypothetical protein [Phytobacter sp. AG2a]
MTNEKIQALKALYANVEKQAHSLRGSPREYSVITGLCPVNVIEMQAQKIQALLSEKEADKALIAEQAKSIAELEARALTVNLPEDEDGQPFGFGKWANSKLPATTGTMTIAQCEDSWREAFKVLADAAGITLTVGGE